MFLVAAKQYLRKNWSEETLTPEKRSQETPGSERNVPGKMLMMMTTQ